MTDLMDRLHRLADGPAPVTPDPVVRRDLLRGRAALRRRRARTGVVGTGVAGVLALGAVVGLDAYDGAGDGPVALTPHRSDAGQDGGRDDGPDGTAAQGLVPYEGRQAPGFVVERVPEGLVVQGASSFHLAVTRPGDDSHLDAFVGKLVVMLESQSVTGTPRGEPVDVGGLDGWVRRTPEALVLTYLDGEHRVVVQAWHTLGLSSEQVVAFAEGVTVTGDARAGVG